MGFESFQVRLQEPHATAAGIDAFLLALPQITVDHDAFRIGDSQYYLWADGKHMIEIELDRSPVHISTRFMLCNPESITNVYTDFLLQFQAEVGGCLVICDEVLPNQPQIFTLKNREEFREVLEQAIVPRRAEWVAMFGSRVMPANSRIAFESYILPHCEPITDVVSSSP